MINGSDFLKVREFLQELIMELVTRLKIKRLGEEYGWIRAKGK
jgi:hypothetical protein